MAFNGVTQDSVNISWTGPTSVTPTYDYYYSTSPTTPTPTTDPTDNQSGTTLTLSDLSPSTTYYFWVRSNCGDVNGNSFWVGPLSFTTTQIPVNLNYFEDFEAEHGWSFVNGNFVNKWVVGTATSNGGTRSLYISNNNGAANAYTISAPITVVQAYRDIQMPDAVDQISVSFDWRCDGEGTPTGTSWDYFRVWLVPTTFVPTAGTQITAAASGGVQIGATFVDSATYRTENFVVQASDYAGQIMRIVFEWRNDGGGGTQPPAAIDNINIAVITCPSPSGLVLDSLSESDATFVWNAPTSVSPTYDYYISETSTTPTPTTEPTGNTAEANVTIDDLEPSTTYYFWVRSNCGDEDGVSFWIGPVSFTTPQIPAEMNFSDGFEGDFNWTTSNGTQTNKWFVGTATSNGGTHSLYISNNNGVANAYNNGSQSTVHAYRDIRMPDVVNEVTLSYDWKAQAESCCDYLRVWLVPITFTPTPGTLITGANSGGQQFGGNHNQSSTWRTETYTFSAAAYAGQIVRLVFEWYNDGSLGTQPPAAVDNINLTALTCPSPTDLSATTEIGSYAVNLTWTPTGAETQWEIIVQELGAGVPNASSTGVIVDSPNYTFMADADLFYEYYVRAICSDDDISFWSGPQQFSIFIPPGCASIDVVGVGVDIVNGSVVVCPDSDIEEINLSASFYGIASTTSYAVESIEYDPPFPFSGGIEMPITSDDDYTPSFTLPFNFCFFGESYDYCQVGDNGVIAFGRPFTNVYGEFCEWNLNGLTIPNTNFPIKNAIYGVYQDLYTTNNPGPNTSINYQVLGTYPCRALVVNFNEVPAFGSDCTDPNYRMTTQIVLYEISNIIEVYVKKREACTGWPFSGMPGQGVLGIQNAAGTLAYTPPGRNTGAWSTELEAWRFVPNGESDVDFQWFMDGEFFSDQEDISIVLTPEQQQELEQNLSLTIEMEAIATYATCTPGEEVTTSKKVDVVYLIEFPNNNPQDLESCSATGTAIFDLTQNNAVILGSFNPELFLINYYLSEEDALVPQNAIENPAEFEGTDGQQIWVRVSDLTNTCYLVKSFLLNFGDDIITPVVEFEYSPAVICVSSNSGLLLPTLADDFNAGGEFSSTEGLVIDLTTGEINLGASTAGIYEVIYTLEAQGCTDEGTHTFTIELVNADTPLTEFNYDEEEYCKSGSNPVLTTVEGFDTTGTFNSTPEGLTIDSLTGQIDLSTSAAGTYEITYLVTSDTEVCEINESHTVTLTVADAVDPSFDPITTTYCIGAAADELLTTAVNGITGTWSPATIDTSVAVADAEYVFTPDADQCANTLTWLITVTEEITPTFDSIVTAYCLNATADALPMTTNGITGTWSPATVDTSVAVVDAEYVFTPDAGQCAVPVSILVTISSEILPTFAPITVCQDAASPALPLVSLEGVPGVWSGVVDTSVAGDFTFTFTPDASVACAVSTTLTVEVKPTVMATFGAITTTYCQGATADALPVADNGVAGSWSPSVIDTATLGEATYVFTPDTTIDCAVVTELVITISTPVTASFDAIATVCQNGVSPALPAISTNGVTGSWLPSAVDTSVVGTATYTFTPDVNQCALGTTLEITVAAPQTPTFTQIGDLCEGSTAPELPLSSTEGIAGTWSPSSINTSLTGLTTYTFTPNTGICALPVTMDITVIALPLVDTLPSVSVCLEDGGYSLPVLTNGSYFTGPQGTGTALSAGSLITTSQEIYIYAPGTLAGCSSQSSFEVTVIEVEADVLPDVEECARYFLPELSAGNVYYTGANQTGMQWFAGQAVEASQILYVSAGTPGSCYDETSFEIVINNCLIQKGISPNGDGSNDFLDLTAYDVRHLSIFNRYGKKVYSRANYSNEWYGQTDNGDELPDGTYYFVIEFNNIETKSGWIYINRVH